MKSIKYIALLVLFLFSTMSNAQSVKDSLSWMIGVQDRGLSPFIMKTDNLGNTHILGIYNDCETCFISSEDFYFSQCGSEVDYLFFMTIDSDGTKTEPLLIETNGNVYVSDFDINLNNELVVFLRAIEKFSFKGVEVPEGYSILNLSPEYEVNWFKELEGAIFGFGRLSGTDQIASVHDQLAINSKNDIVFIGNIPRVYTEEIIDTFIYWPDTFYTYESYLDTLRYGDEEFTVSGSNFFLTSLDHDGNHKWTKVYDHSLNVRASGLAIDKNDQIGLCGYFAEDDFIMEEYTLGGLDTSSTSNAYCMFTSIFDVDGNLMRSNRHYQNSFPDFVSFDEEGNLLVTSEFHRKTFFGNDTLESITPASDQLLLSLDSNGDTRWRKRKGNSNTNNQLRTRYMASGEIISSGSLSWPAFLFRFDANGNFKESIGPDVSTNVYGMDIDFTSDGSLISSGTHLGDLKLDPFELIQIPSSNWGQFIIGFKNITDPTNFDTFLGEIEARIEPSLCNGSSGSIEIYSSIGMNWTSIEWSNGESSALLSAIAPGEYSVTVTDIYDNVSTKFFTVNSLEMDEIPYNNIDDDCNEDTPDDDLDQDGYGIAEDCNDMDSLISPEGIEIANNGIDEDCDGEDLIVSSSKNLEQTDFTISPNPVQGNLKISIRTACDQCQVQIRSITNQLIFETELKPDISLAHVPSGTYMVAIYSQSEGLVGTKLIFLVN